MLHDARRHPLPGLDMRLKRQYEEAGAEMLKKISRLMAEPPRNCVAEEMEQAIIDLALAHPAVDQVRFYSDPLKTRRT